MLLMSAECTGHYAAQLFQELRRRFSPREVKRYTLECTMPRTRKTVKSAEEMFALAASFVNDLKAKSYKLTASVVVGLTGELGAGKTTFVKGVAFSLGVREHVTSPTFVIMKIYKLARKPWRHLVHIDAYRLEDPKELRALGWEALVADHKNLILVEWAEKVRPFLPRGYRLISFNYIGDNERRVSL